MGASRPNFIPEGQSNDTVVRPKGGRAPNFVPGPDHVSVPRRRTSEMTARHDRAFAEAEAANIARQATAKQRLWDEAVLQLKARDPSQIVSWLLNMPGNARELYLLAEEVHANRSAILQHFPAAGPTARETWRDYAESPVAEVEETPAPKKPASTKGRSS